MKNPNKYLVYEHWRPDKDVCFYVGKGHGRRPSDMRLRNKHHHNIQKKLARQGMCVEVRMVASGLMEEMAFLIEMERIEFWRSVGVKLANITSGGEGLSGHRHSDKSRQKMSAAIKLKYSDPEHIEKVRAATVRSWIGADERKRKLGEFSTSRKGTKTGPRSDEVKKRMGDAQRGKTLSPEHKKLLSDLGKKNRVHFIENVRPFLCPNKSPVLCITDDLRFESVKDAAAHYGVKASHISNVCMGNGPRKSTGGKVFRYAEKT